MRKRYEDKLERPEKLDLETGHGAGFVNERLCCSVMMQTSLELDQSQWSHEA